MNHSDVLNRISPAAHPDDIPETLATRAELEARHGHWSDEPTLVEDGRCTRLGDLPNGGTLHLTRGGNLLAVDTTETAGLFRARIFGGSPAQMWAALEHHHPPVWPGGPYLPRYWAIREDISPWTSVYGTYDLQELGVVAWGRDRTEVVAVTEAMNAARGTDLVGNLQA